MQHRSNHKIDAALLGKIVFARFLEMPLRAFNRFVTQVESSAGFLALAPCVTAARVNGAHVVNCGIDTLPPSAPFILGEVRDARGRLMFVYHRDSYAREYIFEEARLQLLRSRQGFSKELEGTLHRLRLINSRNRLTHALAQALLVSQAKFLLSGDPLSLLPLTQAQMSERLRAQPELPMAAGQGPASPWPQPGRRR